MATATDYLEAYPNPNIPPNAFDKLFRRDTIQIDGQRRPDLVTLNRGGDLPHKVNADNLAMVETFAANVITAAIFSDFLPGVDFPSLAFFNWTAVTTIGIYALQVAFNKYILKV